VLIDRLHGKAKAFFDGPLGDQNCHAVLSINNQHAAYAAMAFCPGITVPMGQTEAGEPVGLTFFAASHDEDLLLDLAWAYESQTHHRQMPLGGP
jgi:amidase